MSNKDQRGVVRPQGGHCDIGAYEAGSSIITKIADTNDGVCSDIDCSLREAVEVAPGGGTSTFAPSLSGQTITLGSTLVLTRSVTIDGSALASKVSVSGNNAVNVFHINPGATVNLNSLVITNGYATEYDGGVMGGGILNFGTLTITNSAITNNVADQLFVNIAAGTPFPRANIRCIRTAGWAILGLAAVEVLISAGMFTYMEATTTIAGQPPSIPVGLWLSIGFPLGTFLAGLAVVILAELFRAGADLQDDQALTV